MLFLQTMPVLFGSFKFVDAVHKLDSDSRKWVPSKASYTLIAAQWRAASEVTLSFMYEPLIATLRARVARFEHLIVGEQWLSLANGSRLLRQERTFNLTTKWLLSIPQPCVFLWVGVGYRRVRFVPLKHRMSPKPNAQIDVFTPSEVELIRSRCSFVNYDTEPYRVHGMRMFDAVWSHSQVHRVRGLPENPCSSLNDRTDDAWCNTALISTKIDSNITDPPWSFMPPLFVPYGWEATHLDTRPFMSSGQTVANWRKFSNCSVVDEFPSDLQLVSNVWDAASFQTAFETASIIVNVHRLCGRRMGDAYPMEFFRMSQMLSAGLIVVSQRAEALDEELLAGVVPAHARAQCTPSKSPALTTGRRRAGGLCRR